MNSVFDSIQADIDWRLAELNIVNRILDSLDQKESKVILKSTIPMIYAHWEGFVVSSIKTVFTHLNSLSLNNENYCHTYLTVAYEDSLKSLDDSCGFDKRKQHLITLHDKFSKECKLPKKLDTKSNLNFDVLRGICQKTNLNIKSFDSYKAQLNKLLSIRNSIVHGDNAHVFDSYEDIDQYIDLLENLMLDFKSEIEDLLQNEKYKKEDEK